MGKIPTAEETFKNVFEKNECFIDYDISGLRTIEEAMIEFTKLHVEEALKEASENAKTEYIEPDGCATGDYYDINKDSILNSYPTENIK